MKEAMGSAKHDHRVVTINWNGRDYIERMIDSLLPQLEETDSSLLVFDNGSTDGSAELAAGRYGSTGLVEVERSESNIGFGPAANLVLNRSALPVVVLVNTDTVIGPGCLRTLLRVMDEREDVSFAGPRLLWPDGMLQPSRRDFPFPMTLVRENLPFLRERTAKYSPHTESGYTDWLIGAMMAVRTEPFRSVGGFSEEFQFFHEETDLQYRLSKQGWRSWFEASVEVMHFEGRSSRRIFGSSLYLRHIPGKLLFLKRNGNRFSPLLYRLLMSGLQLQRMVTGRIWSRKDPRWKTENCFSALKILWTE